LSVAVRPSPYFSNRRDAQACSNRSEVVLESSKAAPFLEKKQQESCSEQLPFSVCTNRRGAVAPSRWRKTVANLLSVCFHRCVHTAQLETLSPCPSILRFPIQKLGSSLWHHLVSSCSCGRLGAAANRMLVYSSPETLIEKSVNVRVAIAGRARDVVLCAHRKMWNLGLTAPVPRLLCPRASSSNVP